MSFRTRGWGLGGDTNSEHVHKHTLGLNYRHCACQKKFCYKSSAWGTRCRSSLLKSRAHTRRRTKCVAHSEWPTPASSAHVFSTVWLLLCVLLLNGAFHYTLEVRLSELTTDNAISKTTVIRPLKSEFLARKSKESGQHRVQWRLCIMSYISATRSVLRSLNSRTNSTVQHPPVHMVFCCTFKCKLSPNVPIYEYGRTMLRTKKDATILLF